MPIYEYECDTCGIIFEKRQGFHDEPVADCPNGHSKTHRLIVAPAIVFKGSGFYINDSKSDKSSVSGSAKSDDKKESSSSDSSSSNGKSGSDSTNSETKSEAKKESKSTSSD